MTNYQGGKLFAIHMTKGKFYYNINNLYNYQKKTFTKNDNSKYLKTCLILILINYMQIKVTLFKTLLTSF